MATTRRRSSSTGSTSSRRSSVTIPPSVASQQAMKKRIVVITGGSGALGSMIAKLIYSHWDEVQEIRLFDCRPPEQSLITSITGYAAPAGKPKVTFYPGDVLDMEALLLAFVRANVVIHCAGLVERGSIMLRKSMKRVNIDGTQMVVQSCLECGVQGLIFTGSLTQVMSTDAKNPVRYDESDLVPKTINSQLTFPYYGGSKNEAENLVLLANGQEGKEGVKLWTCSLRCPPMFGENDTQFVLTGLRLAKHLCGYFVPIGMSFGNGTTMQSLYIGNGAWAHIVAAQKLLKISDLAQNGEDHKVEDGEEDSKSTSEAVRTEMENIGGKYFYIGDHSPICTMSNFEAQFLNPMGYRVSPIGIPLFLMCFLAYFIEFVLILLAWIRVDVRFPLNRGSLRFMKISHSFSWEKARKELQYEPLFSNKTALARSMEYYRKVL